MKALGHEIFNVLGHSMGSMATHPITKEMPLESAEAVKFFLGMELTYTP